MHDLSALAATIKKTPLLYCYLALHLLLAMEVFSEEAIQGAILIKAVEELEYSSLRPQQELAVKQFVCGNDVFVCLPTGSEKS